MTMHFILWREGMVKCQHTNNEPTVIGSELVSFMSKRRDNERLTAAVDTKW